MPYYVFALRPPGVLDKRGEVAAFREASAYAKALRRELPPGAVERIKVMFGEHQLAAEDQLLQQRSGINISNKKSLQDFNPLEIVNLTQVIASGKLPASFTLNVEAKNPNDGTGGYPKTDATLKEFPWRLEVDQVETISGSIGAPVSVPGTGEITNIPLTMNIDLIEFFGNKGYENLLNLALALGGQQGTSARIALFATPTVSSSIGDIKYPGELKIVDQSFTN